MIYNVLYMRVSVGGAIRVRAWPVSPSLGGSRINGETLANAFLRNL